jgi:hypothetical protein
MNRFSNQVIVLGYNLDVSSFLFQRYLFLQALSRRQKEAIPKTMQCQKCLEVGHWMFECKNPSVYLHRESRSKALAEKRPEIFSLDLPPDFKRSRSEELKEAVAKLEAEKLIGNAASRKRRRSPSSSSGLLP